MISQNIHLRKTSKSGFGYYASQSISGGTTLVQEKAKAFVPLENKISFKSSAKTVSICDNCLTVCEIEVTDDSIENKTGDLFCSDRCREEHCSFYKDTPELDAISPEMRLALKLAIIGFETNDFDAKSAENDDINLILAKIGETDQNLDFLIDYLENSGKITPNCRETLTKNLKIVFNYSFLLKLPIFDEFPYALGFFTNASRFNHSCRPNCHVWYTKDSIRINTLKDVEAGEELRISYSDNICFANGQERKRFLLNNFSFRCTCDLCSEQNSLCLGEEEENKSNDLYKMAESLFDEGEIAKSWEIYKEFYLENQDELLKYDSLWKIDKILTVAVMTKEHQLGVEICSKALKALDNLTLKTKTMRKTEQKIILNKKHKKKNNSNDNRSSNTQNTIKSPLELKLKFLKIFFKVIAIETEEEYFESEAEMFEIAKNIKVVAGKIYGANIDLNRELFGEIQKTQHGFAAVCRIIGSVDGYYRN